MNSGAPQVPHPIPDRLIDLIAYRFRLLSEPLNLKLLDRLHDETPTADELAAATDTARTDVSRQLGVLVQAGLVGQVEHGGTIRYEIIDRSVFNLCEEVCGGMREQLRELDLELEGGPPAA